MLFLYETLIKKTKTMNQSDFSISSIDLTTDQANAFYQRIVDAIKNYGIWNFEKKAEIKVPEIGKTEIISFTDGSFITYFMKDPIEIWVEVETYTEWKDNKRHPQDYPDQEEITSRSVMSLKIQLVNNEGDDVNCKQLDYNFEEKIKEHFRI